MKTLTIIVLLTICLCPLFSDGITTITGKEWLQLDSYDKAVMAVGIFAGEYACLNALIELDLISDKANAYFSQRYFANFTAKESLRLVAEIDKFYLETGRLDYPLVIAIYFRNKRSFEGSPLPTYAEYLNMDKGE